jgi:prepilin-type N-terminal cleavage/methylation domain-containing protein
MARRATSTKDDRGETLIELMVALAIMATAVVALVGGIGTSVRASDIHRKQAKSQAYLRAFAENLEASMANYPTGYVECATGSTPAATYQALKPATATGYTAEVTGVALWNRTTLLYTACPATGDAGVQRVSLRVSTSDGRASETLDIVLRKPCRPPVDPPLNPASYPEGSACVN